MVKEIRKTVTREFVYETQEERQKHSKEMAKQGYENSGQVSKNFGTMQNPEYHFYGMYTNWYNAKSRISLLWKNRK